ncbi:4013_t:CDS:1, partial [Cetraspora pellucida]
VLKDTNKENPPAQETLKDFNTETVFIQEQATNLEENTTVNNMKVEAETLSEKEPNADVTATRLAQEDYATNHEDEQMN